MSTKSVIINNLYSYVGKYYTVNKDTLPVRDIGRPFSYYDIFQLRSKKDSQLISTWMLESDAIEKCKQLEKEKGGDKHAKPERIQTADRSNE